MTSLTLSSRTLASRKLLLFLEKYMAYLVLLALAILPVIEVVVRRFFDTGVPNSTEYIHHLVLWLTFLGGMLTSQKKDHLAINFALEFSSETSKMIMQKIAMLLSAWVLWMLFWSSISLILNGFDNSLKIGFFPIRLVTAIMPIGFAVMAFRANISDIPRRQYWLITLAGFFLGSLFAVESIQNLLLALGIDFTSYSGPFVAFAMSKIQAVYGLFILLFVLSIPLGVPIFIVLGGITYFLFIHTGGALETIPNEAYTMLIGSSLPAIPLFTLTGFILSESKSGERLVTVFRAFLGWLPGGMAIMSIIVCAFFTTFTGASGITILALGGLLSYILINSGRYSEKFTQGLLTASGSIGLLFAPSLPIILYGVVAQISIKDMFIGGLIPGIFMVAVLSIYAVVISVRKKTPTVRFEIRNAGLALRQGIWDILLPIIILAAFFGGFTTIDETGAIAVLYSLILVLFIHGDISFRHLPQVFLKSIPIIGGILVILAVSRGLSYFIIDAEIPSALSQWVRANVESKYVFLIVLNIILLITGCLMDIYSAIMVVVPLILPLGEIFGIHPVHLGIIFLANMELGYLTPPVGLNLFLASYRFEQPLGKIYLYVVPFLIILLFTVIVITYVPWITLALLGN